MLQYFSPLHGIGTKQLLHLNEYWVKLARNLGKDLCFNSWSLTTLCQEMV
jgi:hypothetical protein